MSIQLQQQQQTLVQVGWFRVFVSIVYHAVIWFCFSHAARSTTSAGAITKTVIAATIGQNVGVLLHFGSTSVEVGNDAIGCSMTVIRQSALPLILTGVASFAQHISCFQHTPNPSSGDRLHNTSLDRHGTVPVIQSFLSSPTRSTRIRWTQ